MTSAARGRVREWVVRDHFENLGCEAARSAGSFGPADIIAWDDVRFYLVAVRMNRWPPPAVRARLANLKAPPGTRKLAAKVTRRGIDFRDVTLEAKFKPGAIARVSLATILGSHVERKLEEMVSGERESGYAAEKRGTATDTPGDAVSPAATVDAAANPPPTTKPITMEQRVELAFALGELSGALKATPTKKEKG